MVGEGGYLLETEANLVVVLVEQAQLDPLGVFGVDRKVSTSPVVGCPEGIRLSGPERGTQVCCAT